MKQILITFLLISAILASAQLPDYWVPTTGGANTYSCNVTPAKASSKIFHVKFNLTNTGASTLTVSNGTTTILNAVALRYWDGAAWSVLPSAHIDVNTVYKVSYNGTYFQLESFGGAGGGSGTVTSIATSNGITGGTITTSGTISGVNAQANASTKGVATYVAADFNDNGSGTISLDYANGQKATSGQDGFLSQTDWSTFNGKQSAITFGTGVQTALGVNIGSAGSPALFNGALGTPSSGVATNLTGTASGLTAGTVTTNANLTGHITSVGNSAFLGSFTLAQLNTATNDAEIARTDASNTFTGIQYFNNEIDVAGTSSIEFSTAATIIALNGEAAAISITDGVDTPFILNTLNNRFETTYPFYNTTFTGTFNAADGSISSADLANSAVASLSGTNTGNQTITNSSDATSHTVTLSASGGTVQLIEGSNITLTTGGTGSAGTVTIASTGGGATDLAFTGASSPVTLTSSTGTDVTFTAGTNVTLSATGTDITINATGGGSGLTYALSKALIYKK